jgi:peptide/nickel transport system substrate-binding protein
MENVKMEKLLRKSALLAIALIILTLMMTVPTNAQTVTTQIPREQALYMESWEDPGSFNTYDPTVTAFLPYLEPLFIFDTWHFKAVPWLAESSQWVDPLTLRVTLRAGTMWNDGQKLTAADVEYTYSLPTRRSEITGVAADLWTYLDKINVIDDRTIEFVLKASNPNKYMLTEALVHEYILPKHVWSNVETQYNNTLTFTNLDNPVGSGPYKLMYASVSEKRTIWIRDDNYWGQQYFGLPQPKYIVNLESSSNEVANMMMEKGDIDWSENFMPNMWDMWQTKHLARGSWSTDPPYYMPVPYMTGFVVFNYLKIAETNAISNPEVRRAMAFAIDWNKICDMAFSRLTTPANPSLLPATVPAVAKYTNQTAVQQYGWTFNATKANEILDGLGYAKGMDGFRHYKNGILLGPYELLIVEGWTDWEAAAEIFKENMAAVGIDITVKLVEDATYYNDIYYGDFTLTFDQPSTWTASSPWYNYYIEYVSRASPAANKPMPAYGNFGSYNNSRVDELLDEIAKTNPDDEATLRTLYGNLQAIILKELPYIPGWFYGPFYMYSTTYWTNWPGANNTYTGGVPYWDDGRGWYPMLLGLKSTTAPATTAIGTTTSTSIGTTSSAPTTLSTTSAVVTAPAITTETIVASVVVIALVVSLVALFVRRRSRRVED